MADLDIKDAKMLVDQLTTVGHPMIEGARLATAMDLVEWCKGGVFRGVPSTPLQQATELVQNARLTFGDWTKAGGTTALRSLFRTKFEPAKLGPERKPFESSPTPEQRAAWQQQYGDPDPEYASRLLKKQSAYEKKTNHASARKGIFWQSIRDPMYYVEGPGRLLYQKDRDDSEFRAKEKRDDRIYWYQAHEKNKKLNPDDVAAFRLELDQYGWDALMKYDWTAATGTKK